MKMVVDIPKYIYEHAKEQSEDSYDEWVAMRAIADGKPLPKHHGRLGDLDALEKEMTEYTNTFPLAYDEAERIVLLMNHFDNAPTIIEADKAESEE